MTSRGIRKVHKHNISTFETRSHEEQPESQYRSPEFQHRSPEFQHRSPEFQQRSPEFQQRSPLSSGWRSPLLDPRRELASLSSPLKSSPWLRAGREVAPESVAENMEEQLQETPPYDSQDAQAIEIEAEELPSQLSSGEFQTFMKSLLDEVSQLKHSMREIIQEELEQGLRSTLTNELKNFFERLVIEPVTPAVPHREVPGSSVLSALTFEKKSVAQSGIAEEKSVEPPGSSSPATCGVPSALAEPLLPKPSEASLSSQSEDLSPSGGGIKRRISVFKQEAEEKNHIKELLKEALQEEAQFDVEKLYSETGIWQALARQDSWFSHYSLIVVVLNVIWIGIDEDLNTADVLSKAPLLSQIVNNIFCYFFTFELVAKFLAFKRKCNAFRSAAFLFDLLIVLFMVWETWVEPALYNSFHISDNSNSGSAASLFRFFRLFRLTRLPRVVKLSAALPELLILAKGIAAAMRSVGVIVMFIGIAIFFFGIIFTDLLRENDAFKDQDSFASVPKAANTLLLHVLCGPDPDFMKDLLDVGWVYYLLYLSFLFVTLLTLMNMLIGVLCDIVSGTADEEKEDMALKKIEYDIGVIAKQIDEDNDGSISKDEFDKLMNHKDTLKSLDSAGVDVVNFGSLASYIFAEDSELQLSDFCQIVARFRGCRSASVQDIIDMQRFLAREVGCVRDVVKEVNHRLDHVVGKLR